MSATVPTPAKLLDTLAHIFAGAAGETEDEWRAAIGDVEKLPTWANVRSNWAVHPIGSVDQLDAIAKAVEIVCAAQPYVAA